MISSVLRNMSLLSVLLLTFLRCSENENPTSSYPDTSEYPDTSFYFPPNSGTAWETTPISQLEWNQNAIQPLKDFLIQTNTKSL